MTLASLYNFSDDNTLSAFATTVSELMEIFVPESEVAIDWFTKNKMVVNPDKCQAIMLDKRVTVSNKITVTNKQTKIVLSSKLLDLQLTN